jgi:hypothetical protein
MKTKFSLAIVILFFTVALSCTKESVTTTPTPCPTPTYPIQGLWIGTYLSTQSPAQAAQYFSFVIKPDGTMLVESIGAAQKYYSAGTWTLTGTSFSAVYTSFSYPAGNGPFTQTATATFVNTGNLNSGAWSNNPTSSGTFTMTRVN